jgi:hypothetical protein
VGLPPSRPYTCGARVGLGGSAGKGLSVGFGTSQLGHRRGTLALVLFRVAEEFAELLGEIEQTRSEHGIVLDLAHPGARWMIVSVAASTVICRPSTHTRSGSEW